jgi:nucleoside-diphosphate-sugar epimerase
MKGNGGTTTLTTVLPGAVFGPPLTTKSLGSTDVIRRLLQGRVPANPRFGLQIVDVRDLADLHVRAMTSPGAPGGGDPRCLREKPDRPARNLMAQRPIARWNLFAAAGRLPNDRALHCPGAVTMPASTTWRASPRRAQCGQKNANPR